MQWTVEQETSRVLAADNPFKQAAADGVGLPRQESKLRRIMNQNIYRGSSA